MVHGYKGALEHCLANWGLAGHRSLTRYSVHSSVKLGASAQVIEVVPATIVCNVQALLNGQAR